MRSLLVASMTTLFLLGSVYNAHAQSDDTNFKCEYGTTTEPDPGRCKPRPQPYLCEDKSAVVKQFCTADGCPSGSKQIEVSAEPGHYCYGRDLPCPRKDVVVGRAPGKCFAYTTLPPKGGKKEDVSSTNPACAPGKGDASTCNWLCLKPPTGRKVDLASVQFLAKEATATCSALTGYSAFDDTACGTPQTIGRCAPSYYTWEVRSVSETEVCGRVKNWSHDRERCAAITFVPK